MKVTIQNESLIVSITSKGAELRSVVSKETQLEYMWSGDPVFWGKTSPVLFPIVGTLKGGAYFFRNQRYNLTRHGFARDAEFDVLASEKNQVTFALESTPTSLKQYPFSFRLKIIYRLEANVLYVMYSVENTGDGEMYFSLGAHPAFKVPMVDGTDYEDHFLRFSQIENTPRWPVNADGLIKSTPDAFLTNTDTINLAKALFKDDALVLKQLRSDIVSLNATTHPHGFDFHFKGFSFLGIWAAKNADFVCIEPWCGIADSEKHDQQLITKEGIEKVDAGESWSRMWKAKFY